MNIPAITAEQMAEVDRLMVSVYHINLFQMMENAGRNLADLAQEQTRKIKHPSFLILCGSGNNGGGGLTAARHLINRGLKTDILLVKDANEFKDIPKHQLDILIKMGIEPECDPPLSEYSLIIDAMIGYGLKGSPKGNVNLWINKINESSRPILALDVPSGFDATLGIPYQPCTLAHSTLTLALPKSGLIKQEAKTYVGELFLADISVPDHLYQSMNLEVGPIFRQNSIIKSPPN